MTKLTDIARYCDEFLRIAECGDWSNALNGVQVENLGRVTKIGAAVDASARTFTAAADAGVDLLIVHHGLFWPGVQAITGAFRQQIAFLLERDIAVYSAHLPLDVHPLVGNNAQLATSLGLDNPEPFLEMKGQLAGVKSRSVLLRDELLRRLEQSLGRRVKLAGTGPTVTGNIGVVSGNGGPEIYNVAREGIDTFITGEAPHWAAVAAEELGVNLFIGGHYATETFGVKALAAHLSDHFAMPWEFIAAPTGL